MRDSFDGTRYGSGFCINGEPTGDETPLGDWQPAFRPAQPCRQCGTPTAIFGRVCIDCELDEPARPAARVLPLHPMRRAA